MKFSAPWPTCVSCSARAYLIQAGSNLNSSSFFENFYCSSLIWQTCFFFFFFLLCFALYRRKGFRMKRRNRQKAEKEFRRDIFYSSLLEDMKFLLLSAFFFSFIRLTRQQCPQLFACFIPTISFSQKETNATLQSFFVRLFVTIIARHS